MQHCVIQRGVRLSARCYTRRSPTLCYTARSPTLRTVLYKAESDTVLYSAESDSPHSVKQGEVRHCVIQRGVWLTAQCYTRRSPTLCYLQHGVVCILIPHCMWYLARGVSVFVREKIICKTILRFRLFIVHSSLSSRSQPAVSRSWSRPRTATLHMYQTYCTSCYRSCPESPEMRIPMVCFS